MDRYNIESDKLVNAIIFFSKKLKHPNKTNIFKALFNSEFAHIRRVGRPMFGLEYHAWQFGPVPKKLYDEISAGNWTDRCKDCFVLIENKDEDGFGNTEIIFKSKINPDLEYFSDKEINILEEIAFIYKEARASDSSAVTHQIGTPWHKTVHEKGEGQLIDYELALDEDDSNKLDKDIALEKLKHWKWLSENFPINVI